MIATQEDLAAFESRLNAHFEGIYERLDKIDSRLDSLEQQRDVVTLMFQRYGTALGELEKFLPKLLTVVSSGRSSRPAGTPPPELAAMGGGL